MKILLQFIICVVFSFNVFAQKEPFKYLIQLEDFNFDNFVIGDTIYSILTDTTIGTYFLISCEGSLFS